jgi:hypothetical protein
VELTKAPTQLVTVVISFGIKGRGVKLTTVIVLCQGNECVDLYFPSPLHITSWLASKEAMLITLFLTSDLFFINFMSYLATGNCISQMLHTLTETRAFEFAYTKITNITAGIFMKVIPLCLLLQ